MLNTLNDKNAFLTGWLGQSCKSRAAALERLIGKLGPMAERITPRHERDALRTIVQTLKETREALLNSEANGLARFAGMNA